MDDVPSPVADEAVLPEGVTEPPDNRFPCAKSGVLAGAVVGRALPCRGEEAIMSPGMVPLLLLLPPPPTVVVFWSAVARHTL